MRKYINLLLATAAVVGLSACNDYLDKEPQDKLIPETTSPPQTISRLIP